MTPKVILMTTMIQMNNHMEATVTTTAFQMVNPMAVVQMIIQKEAIQAMKDPTAITTISTTSALRATHTAGTTAV